MITIALAILKKFWPYILGTVVVLSLWGVWEYRGHKIVSLEKNVAELKVEVKKQKELVAQKQEEYDELRKLWEDEVEKYKAEVAAIKDLLRIAEEEKAAIVKRNLDDFFKKKTKLDENRSKSDAQITASFKPSDTITVPSDFVRLYQGAVAEGPRVSGGTGSEVSVPENRSSLADKGQTFDAIAFTKAVVGNVNEYNALALRCDKLVDVVRELEATYGRTNTGGTQGQTETMGRDVLVGATGAYVN